MTRNECFNLLVCDSFGLDLNSTQLRFNSVAKRIQIPITFWLSTLTNDTLVNHLDSIIISVETIIACKLALFGNTTRQKGRVSCFFDSVSSPDQTRACSLRRRPWQCTLQRPARVQSDSSDCFLAADLEQALQLSSACFLAADLDEALQLRFESATKGHNCCEHGVGKKGPM